MSAGNWKHFVNRVRSRLTKYEQEAVIKSMDDIIRRQKERSLPNSMWYKRIVFEGRLVGWICGQGVYVSTVLSSKMTPVGKEI